MKVITHGNYPISVIRAAEASLQKPTKNRLRVTELIGPPLIKQLTLQHWDDLEIDIEELLPSMLGTAWHKYLEQYAPDDWEIEERHTHKVDGVNVSGQIDVNDKKKKIITDYKAISSTKIIMNDLEDYFAQANTYSWLAVQSGCEVKKAMIAALIKDWSKYKMFQNEKFPRRRMILIPVPNWGEEKQREYIKRRVAIHKDPNVIQCNASERWEKPTTYALKKVGRKSAVKVEPTRDSLFHYMRKKEIPEGPPYFIEERVGECTRCKDWCQARSVCPYNPYKNDKDTQ